MSGLHARLRARLTGALGPALCRALAAPDVVEIMVNADGRVWIETHDGTEDTGESIGLQERRQIIALVADAMGLGTGSGELAADLPALDDTTPETADRFQAMLPPLVEGEAIVIRRHAGRLIRLDAYEARGIVTRRQARLLRGAVRARANIVIAGGTGSGKTTLANALLAEPGFADGRLVTIEDRRELRCAAANRVQLLAANGRTVRDLVRASLRLRPDRIVVGEVRDGAALDVLKSWNTGHPGGLLTIHADGCAEALTRLEDLILEVSETPLQRLIGRAVDIVVFIAGRGEGRRVREIIRVLGWTGTAYRTRRLA